MPGLLTVREHDAIKAGKELTPAEVVELSAFARKVLKRRDGDLAASSHVGIITTGRGTVVEILPKIDLDEGEGEDHEKTRRVFLQMLRRWHGLAAPLPPSNIRALSRFPMLEVFVRQFLERIVELARHGLARRYQNVEDNLPYLRGRIVFANHIRENLVNRARFHVNYDDLTVNRPANRLIHSTLLRLSSWVREAGNRQLLREALVKLAEVPPAGDIHADWRDHRVDRSMPHYREVMAWIGLFLFDQGLATYSGLHKNLSLLFPMEQVFENFVTDSFRRYQDDFQVRSQGPQKSLVSIRDRSAFTMKPDISLQRNRDVAFILDTKWKRIDAMRDDPKYGIDQGDLYQLYAYGKSYGCPVVALVYPRNRAFQHTLTYRFFDGLTLLAVPFDLTRPEVATRETIGALEEARS